MDDLPVRRTQVFVLRVWGEYLDQSPPIWRGEIETVATQVVHRFGSLAELVVCLREQVGMPADETGAVDAWAEIEPDAAG